MKARLDTGLKFLKTSQSRLDFFRRGRICAIFNISGIMAQSNERLATSVITGTITGQHFCLHGVDQESLHLDPFGKHIPESTIYILSCFGGAQPLWVTVNTHILEPIISGSGW